MAILVNLSVVAKVTSSVITRRDSAPLVVPRAGQAPDANTVSTSYHMRLVATKPVFGASELHQNQRLKMSGGHKSM